MKVAMLISGGVDSSVALKLLKQQGYKITAFYIKIWMEDKFSFLSQCPWQEDLKYIEEICQQEKIPLQIIPLQKEYWRRVVKEAVKEVKAGRTPNPDMWCNQRIKFGVFYDYIGQDYDKVASGHYAQVEEENGKFYLKKSPDPIKDQTYFLALLNQSQLKRALFPIGHLTKQEVRQLANKFDLPNKDRKDSQGICFLGKIKYRDFIKEHLGMRPGKIINIDTGQEVGQHEGYWFFTIGQRQGIGLSGGPWYVVKKDIKYNIIYISQSRLVVRQAKDNFEVKDMHWITQTPNKDKLQVKVRHGPKIYKCVIKQTDQGLKVKLNEADQGIAAGQYAVFYDGEYCLGGGVIE